MQEGNRVNARSVSIDEGEVMNSFTRTDDDRGPRMEFQYTDMTTADTARRKVGVALQSSLMTHHENTELLDAVAAIQVPGTRLRRVTRHAWLLERFEA